MHLLTLLRAIRYENALGWGSTLPPHDEEPPPVLPHSTSVMAEAPPASSAPLESTPRGRSRPMDRGQGAGALGGLERGERRAGHGVAVPRPPPASTPARGVVGGRG